MSRSHLNEIEIDAPPADVWKALTEGEELARWFAVAAEVEPGEGGKWSVSWDDSPVAECGRIAVWEPGRHLRLVHESERGGETVVLLDDFELVSVADGARTNLRLVSSGFSSDAAWDDEFEGTKNGWAVFIRNLRHYLEHHRGQPCASAGLPFAGLALSKAEAFERVFGPGGALPITAEVAPASLQEGQAVTIETRGGTLRGRVDFARPPALLGLAIEGLGLLRAEFVGSDELFVHVMLLAHGDLREHLDEHTGPLRAALTAALETG